MELYYKNYLSYFEAVLGPENVIEADHVCVKIPEAY